MTTHKLSFDERIDKAIAFYVTQHLSIIDSAQRADVSKGSLTRALKKRGVFRDRSVLCASNLEKAIDLYVSGYSILSACKEAGVSNSTLSDALYTRRLVRQDISRKPDSSVSRIDPLESKESRVFRMALSIIHQSHTQRTD
ncbi:hypothetical protein [Shewanella glacialipiscicola]|uniref:hypothetical protein n=1 Tax=Shewanella glacialipiscicola TaxID=614069 RepID=UPI003D794C2C